MSTSFMGSMNNLDINAVFKMSDMYTISLLTK